MVHLLGEDKDVGARVLVDVGEFLGINSLDRKERIWRFSRSIIRNSIAFLVVVIGMSIGIGRAIRALRVWIVVWNTGMDHLQSEFARDN